MKHITDIYVQLSAPKAVLVTVRTPENGVLTRTVYNFRGQCWSLLDCSHRNLPISWILLDENRAESCNIPMMKPIKQ